MAHPRYADHRHARRRSYGDELAAAAAAMGHPFLPWHAEVAYPALEYRVRTGRFYYDEAVVVTVPRQNGKTRGLSWPLMAWWGSKWRDQYTIYTAETRIKAARRLIQFGDALIGYDWPVKVTRGIGNERVIFLETNSMVEVVAPNEVAGHGDAIDLAVLDEAWTATDALIQGIVPARAARPRSMLWFLSTQGTDDSEVLNELVTRGRGGASPALGYYEWSADLEAGDDLHNPEHWPRWTPGFGYTVTAESIARAAGIMSASEFARAFGNLRTSTTGELMPAEWWSDTFDPYQIPTHRETVLAFDVNSDPAGAAIAAAFPVHGDGETTWHVDIVAYESGADTSWIPPQLAALTANPETVPAAMATAGGAPARAVLPAVTDICTRAGIPLRTLTVADMGAAAQAFYDGIRSRTLTHGASDALDLAVDKARTKTAGDLWRIDRTATRADSSPLIAGSVAVLAGQEHSAGRIVPAIG